MVSDHCIMTVFVCMMRAIQKVTSGELLTKQSTREKIYYTQKYIHT
jgi:hypothetical protein